MKIQLGNTYVDKLTGFTGVATGHCEYLTGCNQTLLQPRGADPNVRLASEWFDDQRLDLREDARVTLDNSETPGCDRPAPKC